MAELLAASMTLPTILAHSGNDMARIGKRMKLVRGILEASDEQSGGATAPLGSAYLRTLRKPNGSN
jgi:hypothetical protein